MPFNFAKAKVALRRTVHKTFGVQAFYSDSTVTVPVEMSARWHNKIDRFGDLDNQGYAELIQGIDRVIFDVAEARTVGVRRGGEIRFPELGDPQPAFILNTREPDSGPHDEVWSVTRKETP